MAAPEEDVDRKLEQIRPRLEPQYGSSNYLFYEPDIRVQWDPSETDNGNLWDGLVRRAREYVDNGRLEIENEYKVEIGSKLSEARRAALGSADDWASLVNAGLTNSNNNLIHYIQLAKVHDWINESSDDALNALQLMWTKDDSSVVARVRDFANRFPSSVASGPGTRANVVSVLLMALDVQQYPPFRIRAFNKAYESTGYEQPEQGADEAALYEHALGFLDRFVEEASKRGLTLRHRLDAQSLVWAIQDAGVEPPDDRPDIEDQPALTTLGQSPT